MLFGAPAGATIDANTGVIKWAPTIDQLRPEPYVFNVRLCDNGTPNYCVTNVVSLTVTTNSVLHIEHLAGNDYEFTILKGRSDMDYLLMQSDTLCSCECETPWQEVGRVSPTTIPFSFTHQSDASLMFFRLKETPRSP